MSKIKIKNFGPIKEGFNTDDGFMDIKKVTVFIGDQGTGKSTVAKLISVLTWLEKAMYRGDLKEVHSTEFVNEYAAYQNIRNYFRHGTEISYVGEAYSFHYSNGEFYSQLIKVDTSNLVPKIMYVPAERNFLSSVEESYKVRNLPKPLFTFFFEYDRSLRELTDSISLPVSGMKLEYQQFTNTSYVIGSDYKIKLHEASSGLQSFIPLYIVSKNLAFSINKTEDLSKKELSIEQERRRQLEMQKILDKNDISLDEKIPLLDLLFHKFTNTCFTNIVEEPEQNLFPKSQRQILNSLLEFANMTEGNKLIMTTHSPYLINYLSIAIQGDYLKQKINEASRPELLERLSAVVPEASTVAGDDVIVYQLQNDGTIYRLPTYEGIPSDKNYLNDWLAKGNELFDSLLEIEQEL